MKSSYELKVLSSPRLKILQKELEKVGRAENYLDKEFTKLKKEREVLRKKIKKEKEILRLKNKIKFLKKR